MIIVDTQQNLLTSTDITPLNAILIEKDTKQLKIGNGLTSYKNLPYFLGGYFMPQEYGAQGDGQTDDTEAFNKAIQSIPHYSVLYCGKKHLVTKSLKFSLLTIESAENIP